MIKDCWMCSGTGEVEVHQSADGAPILGSTSSDGGFWDRVEADGDIKTANVKCFSCKGTGKDVLGEVE